MGLVVAENVGKDYQAGDLVVNALKDINFTLPRGAFTAFVGPSGSGKTTLLNLIGCLDRPSKGQIDRCRRGRCKVDSQAECTLQRQDSRFHLPGFQPDPGAYRL